MADNPNPKKCRPGTEKVTPRRFIYEGTATQRNTENLARQKQLNQSVQQFDLEAKNLQRQATKPALGFVERQHQAFYCDIAIFVAGADVSPWTVGNISVTLSGRDGANTANFTLQNANDNFILTLQNINDSDNMSGGWRLSDPYKVGSQYSELAKYEIFKVKNQEIDSCFVPNNPYDPYIGIYKNPNDTCNSMTPVNLATSVQDGQNAQNQSLPPTQQAQTTGFVRSARQWPLDPHRPIFHKHDPVRIFIHNPVSEGEDDWLPGFTGFIDSYSFSDDYVTGESTITINCYDIRGVMNKMRVAKNIRSATTVSSFVELADGSLNTGFFKDLLIESNYSSFVAYRTLLELAQYLITGKGFNSATGPKNDQGTSLTPEYRYDLTDDQIKTIESTGNSRVALVNPSDKAKGYLVLTRQQDPTGVGNFKFGVAPKIQKCGSIGSNGTPLSAQDADSKNIETLETWYSLLLLGIRRSPSTGDPVGRDGRLLVQPNAGISCPSNTQAVVDAIKAKDKVTAFNNLEATQGLTPDSEQKIISEAMSAISLTPSQEQAFKASSDSVKLNNQGIQIQTQIDALNQQNIANKADLDKLRNQAPPPSTWVPGSVQGGITYNNSAAQQRTQKMTDLQTAISNYQSQLDKLNQQADEIKKNINLAQAAFKASQPLQDPNSSNSNSTKLSSDNFPVPRLKTYSWNEVQQIGKATTWKGGWSPWNGFLHYLGTTEGNIQSLVDVGSLEQFSNTTVEWEDRASILNDVTSKLDYQWWVTPIGDVVFEFPMYDFFPSAFGKFAGIMTFGNHLKSADFHDETGEIPTLFIGQGSFSTRSEVQSAPGLSGVEATALYANRIILLTPTLASRIGIVPVQETFPSFVGDNPNPLTQTQAASPSPSLSPQQIQTALNQDRANVSEPQFVTDLRANLAVANPNDPATIANSNFITIFDSAKPNLANRQFVLAQQFAKGAIGSSITSANQNIGQSIAVTMNRINSLTESDGTTILLKGNNSQLVQNFFTQSYMIKNFQALQAQNQATSAQNIKDTRANIRNWSILDFQRRLANSSTFDQQNEFRPYLLPNKPTYLVPRQRVGITTTITNTMEINQTCSTALGLTNMKHLTILEDGSLDFTHIAGGKNFPVDYSKMLFSKNNGIVSLDDVLAPNANTPESASTIDSQNVPNATANQTSVTSQRAQVPQANTGMAVAATNPGYISFAGWFDDTNGNTVMIENENGTRTIIPNLQSTSVVVGQKVSASTSVGRVASGVTPTRISVDCNGNGTTMPNLEGEISSRANNPVAPVRISATTDSDPYAAMMSKVLVE